MSSEEMKKENSKVSQGKLNRASGARFELKVRKDLEAKEWITDKWTKNVDLEKQELIPAKRKFNPFNRVMSLGTGFPDFIAFRESLGRKEDGYQLYRVIGVEAKSNGTIDKTEREKCEFLLERRIFKNILIAKKSDKKGKIIYTDFETKKEFDIF